MEKKRGNLGQRNIAANRLLDIDDTIDKVKDIRLNGLPPGISTGWPKMDEFFKFPPEIGQLNLLTGTPGSGKSEVVDALALNMAKNHGWKVYFYSPENNPAEYHLQKLIAKYYNRPLYGNWDGKKLISIEEIDSAAEFIKNHFSFAKCGTKIQSLEEILDTIYRASFDAKMVILDPWNKIKFSTPAGKQKYEYIAECLIKCQLLAREENISFWIVAHPAKPAKNKNGEYVEISLYDVKGASEWYDMIDNGFIVARSWKDRIGTDNLSKLTIAKIKDHRYGKCGEHHLQFCPWSTGFVDSDGPMDRSSGSDSGGWYGVD